MHYYLSGSCGDCNDMDNTHHWLVIWLLSLVQVVVTELSWRNISLLNESSNHNGCCKFSGMSISSKILNHMFSASFMVQWYSVGNILRVSWSLNNQNKPAPPKLFNKEMITIDRLSSFLSDFIESILFLTVKCTFARSA